MKRYLAALTGLLFTSSLAQAQITGKSVPSFTTQGGTVFQIGDTVRIGRGSSANGSFRYIYLPANVFTGSAQKFFDSSFAGTSIPIKDLRRTNVDKTVAVIKGEGLLSGCIDLNLAEEVGEIRTKAAQRPKAAPAVAVVASTNVTDELIKLKQLLDAKVLTPAEFTSQKNRLLKQQDDAVAGKPTETSSRIQTDNDIVFKLVSAVGDKKNQTVTITLSFTNKVANKAQFNTNVRSCTSTDGDEFVLKSGMVGTQGGSVTLFTDAPLKGTYTFSGILPKVTVIKLMAVPYTYTNQATSRYEQGQVEFRNIVVIWK